MVVGFSNINIFVSVFSFVADGPAKLRDPATVAQVAPRPPIVFRRDIVFVSFILNFALLAITPAKIMP